MKKQTALANKETDILQFTREKYQLATIEGKADGIARLMAFRRKIDEVLTELRPLMTTEMMALGEPGKPVKIETAAGTLVLPSGFSERKLSEKEAYSFAEALQRIDPEAHKLCIESVVKIKKSEVNKLRTSVGPTGSLIKAYFASQQPKYLELEEDKGGLK